MNTINNLRNRVVAVLLAAVLCSCATASAQMKRVDDPERLMHILDNNENTVLIDVRTSDEYAAIHYQGSENVPLDTLSGKLPELANKDLIMICRTGNRSGAATELAEKLGYNNVMNYSPGFFGTLAWLAKNEQSKPETSRKLRARLITEMPLAGLFSPPGSVFAVSGERVGLTSFAGKKATVILFWNPAKSQDVSVFTRTVAAMKKLTNTEFIPVITTDSQVATAVEKAAEAGYDGKLYIDSDGSAAQALKITGTPPLFLIDKEGVMRVAGIPDPDQKLSFYWDKSFMDMARMADAGKPVPYPEHDMYGNKRTAEVFIGKKAQDFTLMDSDGKKYSLSQYKGKNLVLLFWAYYCPYSRKEVEALNNYNKTNQDGVAVISVVIPPPLEQQAEYENFIKNVGLSFPVLLDSRGNVSQDYFISTIPVWMVIDKNGIIKHVTIGYAEQTADIIKGKLGI